MKKIAVILAGGRGERFWPKSRRSKPKQFLNLVENEKTMLQLAIERIRDIIDLEDIYIVTNKNYKQIVMEQVVEIPEENIIIEPSGKNTAPCICLAATYISKKYNESVMFVFPSDHFLQDEEVFLNTLNSAYEMSSTNNALVTIGITPTYPETGYGYIKYDQKTKILSCYKVDQFIEKPCKEKAKEYILESKYLWNSGIFIWRTSIILQNMKKDLPEIYEKIQKVFSIGDCDKRNKYLEQVYEEIPSVSIDYGILEKANNVYVIPGNFGWDDVGSWLALERLNDLDEKGNVIQGNVINIKTKNSIIESEDKLVVAMGIKDVIVVESKDAILICSKQNISDIRKIPEELIKSDNRHYL